MTLQKNNHIENAIKYRLSVQVSLNGLSFLVTDDDGSKTIFFTEKTFEHSTTPEELLLDIEASMHQNEILNSRFSEVTLIYSTPIYTLVPQTLFDETKTSEYLKFNSKILSNDYMSHDILENQEMVVVYVPFMNINNFFFEKFGAFNYYHSISVLLKAIFENEKYSLPKMYLHIQQNSFDCIVMKNEQLQLCNTYNFKTPEDFIYYTLFCMEQLKLNPESIPVVLCGDISEADNVYKMAYTYIRNIEFGTLCDAPIAINGEGNTHRYIIFQNAL